jgi:hypothetical protein
MLSQTAAKAWHREWRGLATTPPLAAKPPRLRLEEFVVTP